jgi:tRNA dimethylallyltransferase
MFDHGLVDEVRRLISSNPVLSNSPLSRTAGQAVGYKEVLDFLNGQRDLPTTIELVKLRTRQFAKRQLTWFRSLSECRWVPVTQPFNSETIARQICQMETPSKS